MPLPLSLAAAGAGLLLYASGEKDLRIIEFLGLAEWHTIVVTATLIAVRLAGFGLVRLPRDSDDATHAQTFDG